MNIDGKPATSGVVLLHPGETATIDVPGGTATLRVTVDGGEPKIDAEGDTIVLRNAGGALGHTLTFGIALRGLPGLNFRVRVTSDNEGGGVRTINYTAVES